ncbi:peptidylprolyl isomerase [Aureivirga sp. CE67]|uniref:peptidylprolyl isomerase n=1 Tax=Aureivirga sp. CE67 TaxID=1788983 RepID=UPI0018CA04D9|nr:peptidylprolyl isomerase [Aureivirga sp. CE67]
MAILSKIREKTSILILIVGLALLAFVVNPKDIYDFFTSKKGNSVGSIDGETISRTEMGQAVEAYKAGRQGVSQTQAVDAVWNSLVSEKIYAKQLKEAGIVIGENDVWKAIVNMPAVQQSPLFKNEAGLFNEEKLKEYIANLQSDAKNGNSAGWYNWLNTERNVKQSLERTEYNNLVKSIIGASIEEGKRKYYFENTKMNADYVYVPYSSIKDEEVSVTDADIQAYISAHAAQYQVGNGRDIEYVKFDIKPSAEDIKNINAKVAGFINELKETKDSDISLFVNETSDINYNDNLLYKSQVPSAVADTIFNLPLNGVYGPYDDAGYSKISKVVAIEDVPEVKSSHILIAYEGAQRANPDVTRTKEEAEKEAQKVLAEAKKRDADFAALAMKYSDGPSANKGGDLGWNKDGVMVPAFNDFTFDEKNKVGTIDLVETPFGFHVIKIDDRKAEKAIKLATIALTIEPSEETENKIFEDAELFASKVSENGNFDEIAKEKGFKVNPADGLDIINDNVPGLGSQRLIVNWAFNEDTNIGATNRFDVEKGYVVVKLSGITEKGLAKASSVASEVRPIVMKEKKAELLKAKMNGATLEEIASSNGVTVKKVAAVTCASPAISGVGTEPAVVGAMSTAKLDQVFSNVVGEKGVFAFKVTKREEPADIKNYTSYTDQETKKLQARTGQIFNALKETSNVEDNREALYK